MAATGSRNEEDTAEPVRQEHRDENVHLRQRIIHEDGASTEQSDGGGGRGGDEIVTVRLVGISETQSVTVPMTTTLDDLKRSVHRTG